MSTLAEIKTRILQVLDDASGARYPDALLTEAINQAFSSINTRLPKVSTLDLTITTAGREQAVSGIFNCLFIISVSLISADQLTRELSPDSEFTFLLKNGAPTLYFSGSKIPAAGDKLRIQYAAPYSAADLGSAFPTNYESALVNGAAGHACNIRALHLIEAYGARSEESPRLLELGRLRLDAFESLLSSLRVLQDFGYPPGFKLDEYDTRAPGRYK